MIIHKRTKRKRIGRIKKKQNQFNLMHLLVRGKSEFQTTSLHTPKARMKTLLQWCTFHPRKPPIPPSTSHRIISVDRRTNVTNGSSWTNRRTTRQRSCTRSYILRQNPMAYSIREIKFQKYKKKWQTSCQRRATETINLATLYTQIAPSIPPGLQHHCLSPHEIHSCYEPYKTYKNHSCIYVRQFYHPKSWSIILNQIRT